MNKILLTLFFTLILQLFNIRYTSFKESTISSTAVL